MSPGAIYRAVAYYFTLGLFGGFGLLLNLAALLAGVWPASDRSERFFQRLIHYHFAFFVGWTHFARLLAVRYHGFERLPRAAGGRILIANHPSLTDITLLLARVPEAVCIFKPAIGRNPVLGAAARRAGYLSSDGGHDVIRRAAEKAAAGHTVIIFPEGTRTAPGREVLPFRPGFVLMARRGNVPIQLVRLAFNRPVLTKADAWWKPPPLPAQIDLSVGPCLQVGPDADTAAVSAEIEQWYQTPAAAAACHSWVTALSCTV